MLKGIAIEQGEQFQDIWKTGETMRIGHYEPRVVEKGVNETDFKLKEGDVYWVVELEDHSQMDVKEQIDAEILARLVRVEALLRKKK
jgi:predicted RNase H-like nuclease (RuvC/YqgF family)